MTSRRSFHRSLQYSSGPQCSSTMSFKLDAPAARNRGQASPCTRNGAKFTRRATSLFSDLWTQLLPFLTWQDTNAMLCVCTEWRNVVTEAKTLCPEWRSTVLGPSINGSDSLELLRTNHLKWADTRFAPDLILLSAASKDSSPWHRGGYWEEAIAAIEEARLLPPNCRVAGVFTMNAVLETSEEEMKEQEETAASSSAVTLSVSVAHLIGTTMEMAEFDRKTLRRGHRGTELDNPFTALETDMPSFLMFGVNDNSASQLVAMIEKWYPGATLVGVVSPLSDRCVPLATYCSAVTAIAGHLDRKKNRGSKQNARRRPRPRGQVVFPSTMLLCLDGKVGIWSFSSSGYRPITPVIRCVHSSIAEELSQVVTHDLVSTLRHDGTEDTTLHRVVDLLDSTERLAIERDGRGLNMFSCHDSAPLEHLFDRCSANENKAPISNSALINRLESVFWLQDNLMSLPGLGWQDGAYGVLASHHPTWTSPALTEAIRSTQNRMSMANERVFGAYMVAGALNEVNDLVHAKEIGQLCAGTWPKSQLGGCVVSTSVGPVALPGGVQLSAVRDSARVQAQTTCGAVFYTKT